MSTKRVIRYTCYTKTAQSSLVTDVKIQAIRPLDTSEQPIDIRMFTKPENALEMQTSNVGKVGQTQAWPVATSGPRMCATQVPRSFQSQMSKVNQAF